MSTIRTDSFDRTRAVVTPSLTARRVLGVVVFAVATALSAKIALPLPGTPVPFTFQPLVVMLAGALLGARLGAASQVAYLGMGLAGLPVFAAGAGAAYLLGPTGGYLLAYPVAAFVTGSIVGERLPSVVLGLLAGLAVVYAGGVAWLTALGSFDSAVVFGLRPFILADLVKVLLSTMVVLSLRRRVRDLFTR